MHTFHRPVMLHLLSSMLADSLRIVMPKTQSVDYAFRGTCYNKVKHAHDVWEQAANSPVSITCLLSAMYQLGFFNEGIQSEFLNTTVPICKTIRGFFDEVYAHPLGFRPNLGIGRFMNSPNMEQSLFWDLAYAYRKLGNYHSLWMEPALFGAPPKDRMCLISYEGATAANNWPNFLNVAPTKFCGLPGWLHCGVTLDLMEGIGGPTTCFSTNAEDWLAMSWAQKPEIMEEYDKMVQKAKDVGCSQFTVVGHSKGGVLASIMTMCINHGDPNTAEWKHLAKVTGGKQITANHVSGAAGFWAPDAPFADWTRGPLAQDSWNFARAAPVALHGLKIIRYNAFEYYLMSSPALTWEEQEQQRIVMDDSVRSFERNKVIGNSGYILPGTNYTVWVSDPVEPEKVYCYFSSHRLPPIEALDEIESIPGLRKILHDPAAMVSSEAIVFFKEMNRTCVGKCGVECPKYKGCGGKRWCSHFQS